MNAETSCVKQVFQSLAAAHETIDCMVRRRAAQRGDMRPYQCSDCFQWHLTGSVRRKEGHRHNKKTRRVRPWRPKARW
jgi:hypothetical protein